MITQTTKEHSAVEVANCLISIADEQILGTDASGNPITEGISNLKLQKMLYFAEATHLALFDKQLFSEEIQAWDLGPVVPAVYSSFSKFGDKQIHSADVEECSDETLKLFLKEVWKVFGKYSASELVNISHNHAPWKNNYKAGTKNIVIPKEEIANFYKGLFKLNHGESARHERSMV